MNGNSEVVLASLRREAIDQERRWREVALIGLSEKARRVDELTQRLAKSETSLDVFRNECKELTKKLEDAVVLLRELDVANKKAGNDARSAILQRDAAMAYLSQAEKHSKVSRDQLIQQHHKEVKSLRGQIDGITAQYEKEIRGLKANLSSHNFMQQAIGEAFISGGAPGAMFAVPAIDYNKLIQSLETARKEVSFYRTARENLERTVEGLTENTFNLENSASELRDENDGLRKELHLVRMAASTQLQIKNGVIDMLVKRWNSRLHTDSDLQTLVSRGLITPEEFQRRFQSEMTNAPASNPSTPLISAEDIRRMMDGWTWSASTPSNPTLRSGFVSANFVQWPPSNVVEDTTEDGDDDDCDCSDPQECEDDGCW